MKYLPYIIIGFAVIVGIYMVVSNRPDRIPETNSLSGTVVDSSAAEWETKTDDQPPVAVSVTPVALGKDAELWRFAVAFDTHSGSLDDDPVAVAELADDAGGVYKPLRWEGAGPGGHHREGVLIFNAVRPLPKFIELTIRNVGGIAGRLFRWDL